MFERIRQALLTTLREETLAERSQRMVPAALYALLAAVVYVVAFSTINLILFPGLQLGFDWVRFLTYLAGMGLGLALAGAIVGWFTETYMGVFAGGTLLTLLLLVANLVRAWIAGSDSSRAMQSLVTSLPLIAPAILLALVLRVAAGRHLKILQAPPAGRKKLFAGLIAIVLLAGLIPGTFSTYDLTTRDILASMNQLLLMDAADPALGERFPFSQIPDWKPHYRQDYVLLPRNSAVRAGSWDVTIRYADGFQVTCLVDSASAASRYFTYCSPGARFVGP